MAALNLEEGVSKKDLEVQAESSADVQVLSIANNFLSTYYQAFATDRGQLLPLYRAESKMTFEGETYCGPEKIMLKFMSLSFKQVQHEITAYDCVLTVDGNILIVVIGKLKTDDDQPVGFSQTFSLKIVNGALFIMNDIFRLTLHNN